ncbi:deazapurine DNA modification protein DpdA family protein [Novosphingobium gossypii]|uniref:deazapurine DNA modification protein DpdA family protein n=1 Tax=Novosphingobium gossypii TaxID=1604774 RepID=UPI003D1FD972
MIDIALGLPHLRQGPLLRRALTLKATMLVSANGLSRWQGKGAARQWRGWDLRQLRNVPAGRSLILDCGGFTSHMRYGGFPWTIDHYIDLAASFPFTLFASFDYPVESEIAHDRVAIDERLARTICANRETRRRALDAGIAERFMPVLQGRTPGDYARCADALAWSIIPGRTIGIGSMCRRDIHGPEGLVAVVEHLDRILPAGVRLHCFGAKGTALPYLKAFGDRVASIDSQAYGIAARHDALKQGISKTDRFVADHMTRWFLQQKRLATCAAPCAARGAARHMDVRLDTSYGLQVEGGGWEANLRRAREEINALIAAGEIAHDAVVETWIAEWAADQESVQ